MARYINFDRLRDEILYDPNYDCDTINYFLGIIDAQPIADVEKVKHGEWIVLDECDYKCSKCGFRFTSADDISKFEYCRCGAKMDGKKGE